MSSRSFREKGISLRTAHTDTRLESNAQPITIAKSVERCTSTKFAVAGKPAPSRGSPSEGRRQKQKMNVVMVRLYASIFSKTLLLIFHTSPCSTP
ncbi:hypothetical protein BV25DRAFT_1170885 [Artomyces pyxidatus]|uniref:Uncharacterized protein n=1 Tax=Artomyces pyxidatus TaxID=48021 RepID=A0ACB8SSP0_9AGAM|nr:hypothetical protein BV25DRAFT_1170885 [Artomyces pyxidatus]